MMLPAYSYHSAIVSAGCKLNEQTINIANITSRLGGTAVQRANAAVRAPVI